MSAEKTKKTGFKKVTRRDIVVEAANTLEWLVTAFILAFIFRAFIMEAYRIPTGSMADTLMGDHFRLRCLQCGYKYNYGLSPDVKPHDRLRPHPSRCPSCGHYQSAGRAMSIANGDRILVLKCIYQFFEPKQWDVIVFKNPLDPPTNYIKRLIGRPGETVQIIDGDIYINGKISRKPPKVQSELWMPVYDNDHQPVRPQEGLFNGHRWRQPLKNTESSTWQPDATSPTQFHLDSPADQINTLVYDSTIGNNFKATYAYNNVNRYDYRPYCSDLMVRFYVRLNHPDGSIGAELSKYQTRYKAKVDSTGQMVITKIFQDKETILDSKSIKPPTINKPTPVKFANIDHQLIFQFGGEKLTYDLGRGPDDAGERKTSIQPQVKIFGSGKLTLSHIAIFRDIHYTSARFANGPKASRATEAKPLVLGKDEFFVLGDNSPNSEDGRWWSRKGFGNNGKTYSKGIVPREYLVGKALFVYWPSGFRPFAESRFAVIPNIGLLRFIYGGSDKVVGNH